MRLVYFPSERDFDKIVTDTFDFAEILPRWIKIKHDVPKRLAAKPRVFWVLKYSILQNLSSVWDGMLPPSNPDRSFHFAMIVPVKCQGP